MLFLMEIVFIDNKFQSDLALLAVNVMHLANNHRSVFFQLIVMVNRAYMYVCCKNALKI